VTALSLNDKILAERAREARKTLGDGFLASPRAALGAICDFCPEQPEQLAVLAQCLSAPWAAVFLATLAEQAPGSPDPVSSHEAQWCRQLLAFACDYTEEAPLFAADEAPAVSSSPRIVNEHTNFRFAPAYAAAGLGIVVIGALLLSARNASKPLRPPINPSPVNTALPARDIPLPAAIPPAPASDFPPEVESGSGMVGPPRQSGSHPRTRSRPKTSPQSEPAPRSHEREPSPPKPQDLRKREKPPEETGE